MSSGRERSRRKQGDDTSPSVKPLAAPDVKKFKQMLNEISAEIKQLETKRRELSVQGDQSLVQLNSELTNTTSELADVGQKKTENATEVRKIEEQVRGLGPEITSRKDEASKLLVGLRYKSAERIDDAVSKLRQQLLTRQYSGTEERRLQSEIDNLEGSKDSLREYLKAKEEIEKMIGEQEQLRERRNSMYRWGRELRAREGDMKDRQTQLRKHVAEFRDQKRDLQSQKDTLTQEIGLLYKKRQKLRDDFRTAQSDYMMATNQMSQRETEERERESQRRDLERTARRRRQALEAETLQYEGEKLTCRTLITHLEKLLEASSLPVTDSNGVPGGARMTFDPRRSQSSPAATTSLVATRESSEVKPGEFLRRKNEDLEGYLVPSSKRKSRREKKRHAPSGRAPRRMQYDPMVLSQFEFLSVHPPIAHSQIEQVLQTLRDKLAFFEDKVSALSEAGDSGISSQALGDISEQELNSQEEFDPTSPNRHTHAADPLPSLLPSLPPSSLSQADRDNTATNPSEIVPSSPLTPCSNTQENHSLSLALSGTAQEQGVES